MSAAEHEIAMNLQMAPVTPRILLELSEAVADAKVNLANAVGSPAVSTANELAAAVRLAEAERRYQDAIAFGNFTAPVAPSTTLGVPATPQASVAAPPMMAVSGVREPEPLVEQPVTEEDLEPIPNLAGKLGEVMPPAGGKGRGRAPKAKTADEVPVNPGTAIGTSETVDSNGAEPTP